jgi:c(7)-type cytochrome triheme protein
MGTAARSRNQAQRLLYQGLKTLPNAVLNNINQERGAIMKNFITRPVTAAILALSVLIAGTALAAEQHGGDIVYSKPVKSVTFSHKVHVDDKGLTCDMCHTRFFEMKALNAQESADFKMQALYDGKYCGACHNGTMAFASNTRCASCHTGVKGYKTAPSEHTAAAH